MNNVIDLTGDDLVHHSVPWPNALSSDGIDDDDHDNDLSLLTDTVEARAVAPKAPSILPGTSISRTWRLPSLEEDHMQEVVDLLLPQSKSKAFPSTPHRHKEKALKELSPSTTISRSQKSLKSRPNIPQLPNVAFKTPRTIRITDAVRKLSSPPFAATGFLTPRTKRARQSFKFLQLPPEIRNRVYSLLLTTSEPIEVTRTRQTTEKREGKLSISSCDVPVGGTSEVCDVSRLL